MWFFGVSPAPQRNYFRFDVVMGLALRTSLDSTTEFQSPVISPAIYQPEAISIRGIRRVNEKAAEACFEFKNFSQFISGSPIVSSVQIHSALCEGFYETVGLFASDAALPFGIDKNYVLNTATTWTLLKIDVLFRREIISNTRTLIQFEIADISAQRFRKSQCSVTMNFSGYISGQMTNLLPEPPLFY